MVGIVDVGGGNRCVYSAGVYDAFLDCGFTPDYAIGVSAGSANLITYIAGQKGRTYRFYTEYAQRKEYLSRDNILKYASPVGLDYIFGELSNEGGEDPLDFDAFMKSDVEYYAVATRVSDGKGVFFGKRHFTWNDYEILKASCSLPVICRQRKIGPDRFLDGGVAEPIPFKKAFNDGCDRVIVVLTKPRREYAVPDKMIYGGAKYMVWMPKIGRLCRDLHVRAGKLLNDLAVLENEGKAIVIEPETTFGVTTLSKDIEGMKKLYELGYNDGKKLMEKRWTNENKRV